MLTLLDSLILMSNRMETTKPNMVIDNSKGEYFFLKTSRVGIKVLILI
jgi:hypothetical protein